MNGFAFFHFALQTLQNAGGFLLADWSAFSQPAAALVLTAAWQGAAVALGLALCLRLAPHSPARHRFALWAAGFGTLVGLQILPLISELIPVQKFAADSAFPAVASAAASHPWLQLQLNAAWSLVIAALWLAASLYRAGDLALHSLHLRKLWRSATPVKIDPASLPRSLGRVSGRALQICTTSDLERPSVIGFFAPRILIPDWLFSRLTPGELDQIVLHETEHLRRRDDWTNLLQKLCLVLFPLNPGLAWIERRLCREREMACDDGVIRITRAPRAYAACLTSLAERGLQRRAGALSLGAWHARPELVRRVHSILRRKHALSPVAARAVVAAVGCVLVAGATALARCPRLIAFVPAHRDAIAQNLSAEKTSASKSHQAPAQELTASSHHATAQEPTASSHHATAQELAALKGHDFSRAENAAKIPGALAPGGNPSRTLEASAASKEHDAGDCRRTQCESGLVKGHDFSRAEDVAKISGALAPEGKPSQFASLANEANAPARKLSASRNSFIVMSAWESVEVPNPDLSRKTAADKAVPGSNVRVSGAAGAPAAQQVSPRISITRLYLKIYSTGDQESAWLVIQL
jgi:beta-lactamase regulating signal transducer with metallopeptidase domain